MPAASPEASESDEAYALYDHKAYLEAAAVATRIYVSAATPTARRLEHARLAQECFAQAYARTTATTPRPEYLCRALDVLAATAPLAVHAKDVRIHETLAGVHRATLEARHPGHTCEGGTEPRPESLPAPTPAPPPPVAPPGDASPPASEKKDPPAIAAPVAPKPAQPRPLIDDAVPPRHLKIAGGISLGLGLGLLGGVLYGMITQQRARARAREFAEQSADPFITQAQSDDLHGHLARAQAGRRLAIGTGIAAGALTMMGTTLLVLARRSHSARRWSAAPWWSTAGAGLTLRVQLGSSR